MIKISADFFESKQAGSLPVVVCRIETQRTSYLFGRTTLNDDEMGSITGVDAWDGSVNTGDGGLWGGLPVSNIENRVLQFGSVGKSLVANAKDLPTSLSQAQIGSYSIQFDNVDGFFSTLLGDDQKEPLLGQKLKILQGFRGDAYSDFVTLFDGEITQVVLKAKSCRLLAEDTVTIFPVTSPGLPVPTVYGVNLEVGKTDVVMAQDTFTPGQMAAFFTDIWLFNCTFFKDNISEACEIFTIENTLFGNILLKIGIDSDNFPFVQTGQDVESGSPSTMTYTSTAALTAEDIASPLTLRIFFDSDTEILTFTVAGLSTEISSVDEPYDEETTNDNIIQLGKNFEGDIQNWIWNTDQHYWVNAESDNGLADVPDIVGGLDITLTDGAWAVWPPS